MFTKTKYAAALATVLVSSLLATGCSHSPTASQSPQALPAQSVANSVPAPAFNPTVVPPAATAADASAPQYTFEQQPAPVPPPTVNVEQHRHRYLHIVMRGGQPYLADNYDHYYNTGRTSAGQLYPVYQDPNTAAVYPLYYDEQRDDYYRCVDNAPDSDGQDDAPAGYYRNYIGDPDDVYYEGDPNQEDECQSPDCQPYIVNYYTPDSGYSYYRHYYGGSGFNASYGYYNGPVYYGHNNSFVDAIPFIVAAFILFQPNHGHDGGGYGGYGGGGGYGHGGNGYGGGYDNRVVVNNHYYYQRNVVVNNYNNHAANVQYTAMPGPPLGHFGGYRPSANGQGRQADFASGRGHGAPLPPVFLPGQSKLREQFAKRTPNGIGDGGIRTASYQPERAAGAQTTARNHTFVKAAAVVAGAAVAHHYMTAHNNNRVNGAGQPSATVNRTYPKGRPAGTPFRTAAAKRMPESTYRGPTARHTAPTTTHYAYGTHNPAYHAAPVTVHHTPTLINRRRAGGETAYSVRPLVTYVAPKAAYSRPAYQRPIERYTAPRATYARPSYQRPAEHYTAPRAQYQRPIEHYAAPAYHESRPAYVAPRPVYRAPAPVYRAGAPVYRAPAPVYRAPAPVYRAPAPAYRAPAPAYHAPAMQAPRPAYHAPAPHPGGGGDHRKH
jgi:hypothetical protein